MRWTILGLWTVLSNRLFIAAVSTVFQYANKLVYSRHNSTPKGQELRKIRRSAIQVLRNMDEKL